MSTLILIPGLMVGLLPGQASAEPLFMDHDAVIVEPIESDPAMHPAFDSPEIDPDLPPQAAPLYVPAETAVEPADQGPEIINVAPETGAAASAEPVAEPVSESVPETVTEAAREPSPEPAGSDPLMEAAEIHDKTAPALTREAPAVGPAPVKAAETPAKLTPEAQPAKPVRRTAKPASTSSDVAAVTPDDKVGIYDKWAQEKVEGQTETRPHPLAAAHPDDFVVICEAGCERDMPQIVYIEPRNARGPVNETPIKSGLVAGSLAIDCVGGCYGGDQAYGAVAATWDPNSNVAVSSGDEGWMTTVKKAAPPTADAASAPPKKGAAGDGRWYDRIN